jgi:hypothetical protein
MKRVGLMMAIIFTTAANAHAAAQTAPARPLATAQTAPARPPATAPAPTIPTRVTVQMLGPVCGQDRGGCLSYILGAVDAYASALVAAGRPQVFCIPRGTTNDQVAQAVVARLRAKPEPPGSNAALSVLGALTATYPCGY